MPARLTIHYSHQPVQRFILEEGREYLVGRGQDCDLMLEEACVSRRHARLVPDGDGWSIRHLGSKNGLTVNGEPCEDAALEHGAWISFGGLLSQLELISDEVRRREDRQALRRWQTSLQLQTQLDPAAGLETLLERVLSSILELAGAERGFVMLVKPDGGLELSAAVGLDQSELEKPAFSGSVGAVERTLATGEPVTLADARLDAELGQRGSILSAGIRALISVPLAVADKVIGVAYADSREPGSAFTDLDVEILTALASHAALAIAVARIQEEVEGIEDALPAGDRSAASQELAALWQRSLPSYRPAAGAASVVDLVDAEDETRSAESLPFHRSRGPRR